MPDYPFAPPGFTPPAEPPKKGAPAFDAGPLLEQVNATAGRLRMNEERLAELRKKVLLLEQNMLQGQKKSITDIKNLISDVTEIKRQFGQFQDRMLLLLKEIGLLAKKEDVDVLKKYLDLWQPVKFITADHAEKIIDERLEELGLKKADDESEQ